VPDDRGLKAYFAWLEGAQRFDYFVTGVSLALVGYVVSNLTAAPFALNSSSLEAAGVIILLASVYAGFRRIEASLVSLQATGQRLLAGGAAGALKDISRRTGPSLRMNTGEVIGPGDAAQRSADQHRLYIEAARQEGDWSKRAFGWYGRRNFLLMLGVLVVVVARILRAYAF
jgi:hypothetical protein